MADEEAVKLEPKEATATAEAMVVTRKARARHTVVAVVTTAGTEAAMMGMSTRR